jgi:TetR/AcrR family transcriptional regulator, transcriptional repressor for nem operon
MAAPGKRKIGTKTKKPRDGGRSLAGRGDVKERLLNASLSLFATAGYNAVGVKEIVDKAGVPKGSFYAYFRSKEALGCAVIDRYSQMSGGRLRALTAPDDRPVERLRRHFAELSQDVAAADFLSGCLLGRFSTETTGQSEPMRQRLLQRFADWTKALAQVVSEAAARQQLLATLTPKDAATFLLNSWEGAVLRARVDRDRAPLDVFEKVAFASLFKREERSPTRTSQAQSPSRKKGQFNE